MGCHVDERPVLQRSQSWDAAAPIDLAAALGRLASPPAVRHLPCHTDLPGTSKAPVPSGPATDSAFNHVRLPTAHRSSDLCAVLDRFRPVSITSRIDRPPRPDRRHR
jgi:hypothetical protein